MSTSLKKKIIAIGLIASMAAVAVIGGTLAYFTDEKEKTNTFVVGDIEINIIENNGLDETDSDFKADDPKDSKEDYTSWLENQTLLPDKEIEKDVYIRNDGTNSAYVRVKVDVPNGLVPVWDSSVGTDWEIVDQSSDTDSTTYILRYNKILVKGEETPDCLTAITMDKYFNDETIQGTKQDVVVYGEAIQASGFATADEAFAALDTQLLVDNAFSVADDAALNKAIEDGETVLLLDSGSYIIPDSAKGKTLTIIGSDNTVIATQDDGSYEGCDYSLDGSTVTFENITINTNSTTYTGYARLNATYNNCTINGTYTLYGNSTFNNCTFNVSGDVYNIWTWGAPNATFNNCTFNSDGKAMLLYGTVNTNLTINNCEFNDNGGLSDLKAAIEIGNDYGTSYTLTVNNTTVNGYEINDKGINTGTTLWANKNSMGTDKLNVVVDDVDVY